MHTKRIRRRRPSINQPSGKQLLVPRSTYPLHIFDPQNGTSDLVDSVSDCAVSSFGANCESRTVSDGQDCACCLPCSHCSLTRSFASPSFYFVDYDSSLGYFWLALHFCETRKKSTAQFTAIQTRLPTTTALAATNSQSQPKVRQEHYQAWQRSYWKSCRTRGRLSRQ